MSSQALKFGLFALAALTLLAIATIRISQTSLLPGSTYPLYTTLKSAQGIQSKTPVMIAGIRVGSVDKIELTADNQARLKLAIENKVKITSGSQIQIKSMGVLGDTFLEILPPVKQLASQKHLTESAELTPTQSHASFEDLTGHMSSVLSDVKEITNTLKTLTAGEDSVVSTTLKNMQEITESVKNLTTHNEKNMDRTLKNLESITRQINQLLIQNSRSIELSLQNLAQITNAIQAGEGTVGKLINQDETYDKINDSLDSINSLLGSADRLQIDLGYHAEYLGQSGNFKNYVSFKLKPRPDKYFLFELVQDADPDTRFSIRNTTVSANGQTTQVTEEIETQNRDGFLFSAQFAKKIHDFTLRGGLIESSGGAGIDYTKGPFELQFSAFDFETERGERPHLKFLSRVNVTPTIYILAGLDDFINPNQDPDWFIGAGVEFSDDDIKSLLGIMNLGSFSR